MTLRHIAHLTVISEEKIISKSSPVVSGEATTAPLERSIFSFLLTGIDDAELSVVEKPKDRKARLDAEEGFVQSLLQQKENAIKKLIGEEGDVTSRLKRIDESIDEATRFVSATNNQIQDLERLRENSWEQFQKSRSRHLFVSEQLKRLTLLGQFYTTDRQRLESVIEAGRAFELLPGGECAVCGSQPESGSTATAVEEFKNACTRELEKLRQLATELQRAVSDMQQENSALEDEIKRLERLLADTDEKLKKILEPQSSRADHGLKELIRVKTEVSKAADLQAEIAEIHDRLKGIDAARKKKTPKTSNSPTVGTAGAARFCAVVQELLLAWKYPLSGNVAFDPDAKRFDIVIGDQDRGSMGKGYRAITHAAFVIGLMKYCRRENIPHPGFVLLDTPLNPFKGPDEGPEGKVNDEIKNAFFEDLARDQSGDQYIVLENTEPPQHLIPLIRYHHFSKNRASERYGFFPASLPP
ncbi:MAG: hypothetical protein MN733_40575 [Nitrososphaera sp.]|nr:hypothetical protein [Nitrososphaera sp.]